MVELVDSLVLEASAERRESSSLSIPTNNLNTAGMVELVDTTDLKSVAHACRFDSGYPYQIMDLSSNG